MKLLPGVLLLLPTLVSAQTRVVVPQTFAAKEATGSTNVPFGRSTAMRVQMAYDTLMFPWQGGRQIQSFAFRSDGPGGNAGKKIELQASLSTMSGSLAFLSSSFADNRGKDATEVLRKQQVSLPILKARSQQDEKTGPAPFVLRFPLDKAFQYTPSKGHLLLETVVHKQPRGAYRLDSTWVCSSPLVFEGPKGCAGKGRQALEIESVSRQLMWSRPATLYVKNAAPFAKTMILFGTRTKGTHMGIRLPYDAAPIGAPGCYLSVDIHALSHGKADVNGYARFDYLIPAWSGLRGFSAVAQGLSEDPKANALGLISSQPARLTICGWEPVARVFASGLSVDKGFRELGHAPVLELTTK